MKNSRRFWIGVACWAAIGLPTCQAEVFVDELPRYPVVVRISETSFRSGPAAINEDAEVDLVFEDCTFPLHQLIEGALAVGRLPAPENVMVGPGQYADGVELNHPQLLYAPGKSAHL